LNLFILRIIEIGGEKKVSFGCGEKEALLLGANGLVAGRKRPSFSQRVSAGAEKQNQ